MLSAFVHHFTSKSLHSQIGEQQFYFIYVFLSLGSVSVRAHCTSPFLTDPVGSPTELGEEEPFLCTEQGSPFSPVFRHIRLQYIINDLASARILERDNIIPPGKIPALRITAASQ